MTKCIKCKLEIPEDNYYANKHKLCDECFDDMNARNNLM